jgi:hypothetical protein
MFQKCCEAMPLDAPMLALIARFVVREADLQDLHNEEYLRAQLASIRRHVESFPAEQREQAALDWIAEHAQRYRQEWQNRAQLPSLLPDRRCPDCPLVDHGAGGSCMIHKRWVGLLNEYAAGEIPSASYIKATLRLLQEHKDHLKISLVSPRR